jgi:vancomycin resistance protein YoaR
MNAKAGVVGLLALAGLLTPGAVVGHWVQSKLERGGLAAGLNVAGLSSRDGESAAGFAARIITRCQARRVVVMHRGRRLIEASFKELKADCDPADLSARLAAIGKVGGRLERLDALQQAQTGRVALAAPWHLPLLPFAERLIEDKRTLDQQAIPARWDFDKQRASRHRNGLRVDIDATLAKLRRQTGPVELVVHEVLPRATQEQVAAVDRSVLLARYQTRFGFAGSQVGRATNVARAASALNGLVIFPDQTVSFNRLVGPRSLDNGFAQAGEIYKGEMRMGIGGGTCQAASTFHAAMFLSGMEVVERSPHSRPSGYIPMGLDATVAYPHVDLKLRNPFPFAIVVRSEAKAGMASVAILGKERPATVSLRTATVGIKRYKRKIRRSRWLKEGRVIRKQAGRRGVTIEKVRTFRFSDGRIREEVSRDVYPPTREIYLLGPKADESELPPLPGDA